MVELAHCQLKANLEVVRENDQKTTRSRYLPSGK